MKNTMAKLLIVLLSISSISIAQTHAADDFEALLNALNEGSVETEAPVEEEVPMEIETDIFAEESTGGEMDLEAMTAEIEVPVETTPVFAETNTYSNEANIVTEPVSDYAFEPEESIDTVETEAPILDEAMATENESDIYTAPRNDGSQLTMTGMEDSIYVLIFLAAIGGVFYARRKKA